MATIQDPDRSLDLEALAQGMAKVLPTYARPLFLRIIQNIDLTGTYKMRKVDYQKDSFDLDKISDDIYFLNPSSHTYVPFTKELYDQLKEGKLRV